MQNLMNNEFYNLRNEKVNRLYRIYGKMKQRCFNSKNERYKYYGGKGITIYEEWLNDFDVFKEWALKNGYKSNLTIDRIDNNRDYEPDNCRWITREENSARVNKDKLGSKHNLSKAVEMLNINTNEVIKEFGSCREAARYLNHFLGLNKASHTGISAVCLNKNKSCYGFKWRYK